MQNSWSRRRFIGVSAGAAATLAARARASAPNAPALQSGTAFRHDDAPLLAEPIALAAVDAARAAGAQYADVRITRELSQGWHTGSGVPLESQLLAVGVRALVRGYWGFAAGTTWSTDEAARLAREAVAQAAINARGKPRTVEWLPVAPVHGTWSVPVEREPTTVSPEELADYFNAIGPAVESAARTTPGVSAVLDSSDFLLRKLEKTFASTDGSAVQQTLYSTSGTIRIGLQRGNTSLGTIVKSWPARAVGWEYVTSPSLFAELPSIIASGVQRAGATSKPADIGRFDVVCSASTMAQVVARTIGPATQLDRALGYEANAGGTSYLNDPLSMLGTFRVGSPLVTVVADRSRSQGLATVKWDDEGVVPDEFTLVDAGILMDFQTSREQGPWLRQWYESHGRPVRGHGCADSFNALGFTTQHTPNLTLRHDPSGSSVDELIHRTRRGIFIDDGVVDTDFQCKTGTIGGTFREIRDGVLGPYLVGVIVSFESSEFWKNVVALGGPASAELSVGVDHKGEPGDTGSYSISAVPAAVRGATIMHGSRRA